jgi:hypothetical protein
MLCLCFMPVFCRVLKGFGERDFVQQRDASLGAAKMIIIFGLVLRSALSSPPPRQNTMHANHADCDWIGQQRIGNTHTRKTRPLSHIFALHSTLVESHPHIQCRVWKWPPNCYSIIVFRHIFTNWKKKELTVEYIIQKQDQTWYLNTNHLYFYSISVFGLIVCRRISICGVEICCPTF